MQLMKGVRWIETVSNPAFLEQTFLFSIPRRPKGLWELNRFILNLARAY